MDLAWMDAVEQPAAIGLPLRPQHFHRLRHPGIRVRTRPSPAYGTLRYRSIARAHSFGTWLEPRYIFGAGQLLDQ